MDYEYRTLWISRRDGVRGNSEFQLAVESEEDQQATGEVSLKG
jgi:hypothetical protein